jgi:hypothetical protein
MERLPDLKDKVAKLLGQPHEPTGPTFEQAAFIRQCAIMALMPRQRLSVERVP